MDVRRSDASAFSSTALDLRVPSYVAAMLTPGFAYDLRVRAGNNFGYEAGAVVATNGALPFHVNTVVLSDASLRLDGQAEVIIGTPSENV